MGLGKEQRGGLEGLWLQVYREVNSLLLSTTVSLKSARMDSQTSNRLDGTMLLG